MSQDPTRREFLETFAMAGAVAATGGATFGARVASQDGAASVSVAPSWVDRPMRWAQLTLVENDPGSYDPKFWLDYFRRTKADAVCLSAGGVVAYYPTNVPFHHRSQWL